MKKLLGLLAILLLAGNAQAAINYLQGPAHVNIRSWPL